MQGVGAAGVCFHRRLGSNPGSNAAICNYDIRLHAGACGMLAPIAFYVLSEYRFVQQLEASVLVHPDQFFDILVFSEPVIRFFQVRSE